MLIKNNSQKIIGFGKEALLPDKTLEIADSYKNNAIFQIFVKKGDITVIEEKASQGADNTSTDKGSSNPPAAKPTAEEIKVCSKKDDYIKLAEKYGIDVNDSMTVKEIKAALEA